MVVVEQFWKSRGLFRPRLLSGQEAEIPHPHTG
jgi:hypothetical protein